MCGYRNWIGSWGVCELWKNSVLILLISSQKFHLGDDDASYDVIIQEPVSKWRHNYYHEISSDPNPNSVLFQIYSTIFILMQINRASFAVRGPSSFVNGVSVLCNYLPLGNGQGPSLERIESPTPSDALYQVKLKLFLWLWRRRFLNFVDRFLLFRNYFVISPWKSGWPFI